MLGVCREDLAIECLGVMQASGAMVLQGSCEQLTY
jgi:hypothetical protein